MQATLIIPYYIISQELKKDPYRINEILFGKMLGCKMGLFHPFAA
jgi:hypothetical protein